MLAPLLFFLLTFGTIVTLGWAGARVRLVGRGFAARFMHTLGSIPGGDDWIKGSQKRLRQAGYRSEKALAVYLTIAAGVLLGCLGGMLFLQRNNPGSSMSGGMIAAGIIGFVGPQFVLGKLATRYRRRLQEALPDTIDLLAIVLGTGLAVDQAMTRVSDEMQHIYPELANEFYTVTMQVRAGQERSKAFAAMVRRTGVEDIKSLSAMIVQSERFGTSLSQALNAYASDLRIRRRLRAEAAVGRAGIKMLFPIMLFILPVLFVVTLVPAVIKTMQDMQLLGR
ncbi:MAG: type II secretion system F family protein [Acidobacteriota bacterium]|nr:type II secretion system F family protein [Acidobacteriota bacterium]